MNTLERYAHLIMPEPNSGCLLWLGRWNNGYGRLPDSRLSHRVIYEEECGPIPAGLEPDHKCRVRCCVNHQHLEPVTRRVNLLRGKTIPAARAAQTHCIKGHQLSGENVYLTKLNQRKCKICRREALRRFKAKRKS